MSGRFESFALKHSPKTFRRRAVTVQPSNLVLVLTLLISSGSAALPAQDNPVVVLQEADRLAWLKNWSRAEPLFARAEQLFLDHGDQRNALYAMVGKLRGQLPRLSNQQASNQLSDLLGNPLVENDTQLRLRVLIVKGDTD